ncbi:MAG: zinc-ribbon domain-containing protein [Candidatus Pacebacteria bacterium]|nr:zinc-ribbon domain-containing protein [Candidatus Paceibacterota bacterium]
MVSKDNCLATVNPALARQWHPKKNGKLTPRDFTANSNKKFWWQCPKSKNHVWRTSILSRNWDRRGCPYCANQYVDKENCLATVNPALARQWHPTKNGKLTPRDIVAGSTKKAWWLCSRGHEWQAMILSRNKGVGCPQCHSNSSHLELCVLTQMQYLFGDNNVKHRKKIINEECDVFIERFKIAIEIDGVYWHREKIRKEKKKNKIFQETGVILIRIREEGLPKLSSTDIFFKSTDRPFDITCRVIKKILKTEKLHTKAEKKLKNYLKRKDIANKERYLYLLSILPSPIPGTSLQDLNKKITAEWHPTKNGSLTPRNFLPSSHQKIWWQCPNNHHHEWEATIDSRNRGGHGCPYCSGNRVSKDNCLATVFPALARQWHPTKNGKLTPQDFVVGSHKKVWWLCPKNNEHEWETTIGGRSRETGCPYCSGKWVSKDNCLATVNPTLAREWHLTKNGKLTPRDFTANSNKKFWWQCPKFKKHVWKASILNRNWNGSGCPYCSGNRVSEENCLATVNPALAWEWHPTKNGKLTPRDVFPNSGKKVWWQCPKFKKHVWKASILNRNYRGIGCPYCAEGNINPGQMALDIKEIRTALRRLI